MAAGPPFGVVKSFGSVEVKLLLRATSWQAVELGRISRLSERSRVPLGTRVPAMPGSQRPGASKRQE